MLTPPGGAPTWTEALRRGEVDTGGLLEFVSRARLMLARAHQYEQFLEAPEQRRPHQHRVRLREREGPAAPPATTVGCGEAGDSGGPPGAQSRRRSSCFPASPGSRWSRARS